MDRKIRVGVIGAGNMGRHHIRNYAEMDTVDLVAFSDPNPTSEALAQEYGTKRYDDYHDMVEHCQLDAVSIVVPTEMHFPIALHTIKHGIHTLLEKPIASTQQEAEELITQANQMDIVFTVGHIERYNPVVTALTDLLSSGRLGKVSSIISQRLGGMPNNEPQSDVVMDLAIHDIDILNHLLDSSGTIIGVHGSRTFHSQATDSAEILLSYEGTSGFIQANWVTPVKIRRISITGEKGFVMADYITQEITFYDSNMSFGLKDYDEFVFQFSNPTTKVVPVEKIEPLRAELEAFTQAAMGTKPAFLVNPHDALEALRNATQASRTISEYSHL